MHQRLIHFATGACALLTLAPALLRGRAAAGAEFSISAGTDQEKAVDVASNGSIFLAVWQDDRNATKPDIYGARVDAAGDILGSGVFPVCTAADSQASPRVASDGTGFLVVWVDAQAGALELDIHGVTVAADGTVGTPFVISDAADRQDLPDVAWTGSYYVVAWQDERDIIPTDWDIYAARVSAAGAVQDTAGIKVTGLGAQGSVAVAGGAGDALLAHRHGGGNEILGAIVDASGTVAAGPFNIAVETSTQKSPCAEFGRGVFVVAWEDYRASAMHPDVYVARVSPAGTLLDASPHVAVATGTSRRSATPAVAFDGGNFVVSWEEGDDGDSDVWYARVLADAVRCTVREPGGVALYAGSADQDAVSLACVARDVLAAWTDDRTVGTAPDVYAALVVTNDPPEAGSPSFLPLVPAEGDVVALDGTGAYDPEGKLLDYEWTWIAGAAVTLSDTAVAAPTFTAPEAGADYSATFEFRVSDGVGWCTPEVVVVGVLADDDPPVAAAVATPENVLEDDVAPVALDGTGSFDPEGGPIASWSWFQTAGEIVVLSDPQSSTTQFAVPDCISTSTLTFELTVTDGGGLSGTTVVSVTVTADNDPPVADAGADMSVKTGAGVFLDGGASADPEGRPLTYAWSQVSGGAVALGGAGSAVPGFTAPDAADTLVFELRVSDGVNEATDQAQVTVDPLEDLPPEPSNVQAAPADSYSANVTWLTTPDAYGSVRYGTTGALGSESAQGPLGSSHDLALANLRAGATYYYVVRSEGANGAWTLSGTFSFTLAPPPAIDDADGDGMPDSWEATRFGAAADAEPGADPDGDGLDNLQEYQYGTDPRRRDTDGDGFSDGYEVGRDVDPLRSDSVPAPIGGGRGSGCSPGAASGLPALLFGVFLLRALVRRR